MASRNWLLDDGLQTRRNNLIESGFDAYCLYCATGREIAAAQDLNEQNESFIALPFLRMMHKSRDGVKTLEQDVLLKGYIFLFAPRGADIFRAENGHDVYFVLGKANGERELTGSDFSYAQWVLSLGGVAGVSKALKVNERVKIIEGPLLELEGWIREYSKRGRSCRVEIDVVGKQISAWLPFEWVEGENLLTMEALADNKVAGC